MSETSPDKPPASFDAALLRTRRDRAEALGFAGSGDFLHREVAATLAERLADVTRRFSEACLIGSGGGVHAAALRENVGHLRQIELSPARAKGAGAEIGGTSDVLPLDEGSLDLVISALELHMANDPVGQLIQMRRALQPDGLMLAALFGGQTLQELRISMSEAEVEICGGLSPRVAPMAEIRELGALLQRAGYALPVADSERFEVSYASPLELMHELRRMGETNVLTARRRVPLRRDVLMRACEIYAAHFPASGGRIRATFEIIFLTGWAPAASQPKPLRPGSATARLADALGVAERSAGEKAGPAKPGGKG